MGFVGGSLRLRAGFAGGEGGGVGVSSESRVGALAGRTLGAGGAESQDEVGEGSMMEKLGGRGSCVKGCGWRVLACPV